MPGQLLLTNSLGYLAVIGLLALVAIHFLQQHIKKHSSTTNFLVKRIAEEPPRGSTFSIFLFSKRFLLQILAVLILTFLLLEPHIRNTGKTHRIVLVLDSSYSMSVFKPELFTALDKLEKKVDTRISDIEWVLIESGELHEVLYSGMDFPAMRNALKHWTPHHNKHSLLPAIESAQAFLPPQQSPIVITDNPGKDIAPFDVISVGKPVENVGFSGYSSDESRWSILVKNYGSSEQRRTLTLSKVEPEYIEISKREITLAPNQVEVLSGIFPENDDSTFRLSLNGDSFSIDDSAPLIPVHKKSLNIFAAVEDSQQLWLKRIKSILSPANFVDTPASADAMIISATPSEIDTVNARGLFLATDDNKKSSLLTSLTHPVVRSHELLANLNFSGLLSGTEKPLHHYKNFLPILLSRTSPLLFISRRSADKLVIGRNLTTPDSLNHASLAVTIYRFFDTLRARKKVSFSAAIETNSQISLASSEKYKVTIRSVIDGSRRTMETTVSPSVPSLPSVMTVRHPDKTEAKFAVFYNDPYEADFRSAHSTVRLNSHRKASENNYGSPINPSPLILLLITLISSCWYLTEKK